MALINLSEVIPPALTGIFVERDINSITLRWDPSSDPEDVYEIWTADVEDVTQAVHLATVTTNSYTEYVESKFVSFGTYGRYYDPQWLWVRAKNKYGTLGPMYDPDTYMPGYGYYGVDKRIGYEVKDLWLNIYADTDYVVPAPTLSIENIKVQLWWRNPDGSPGTSGLVSPSSIYNTTMGPYPWTNPTNALVDDTSSTTNTGQYIYLLGSDALVANLGSMFPGLADDIVMTGFELQVTGQTTNKLKSGILATIGGWNGYTAGTRLLPLFTADNSEQTLVSGGSTDLWNVGVTGVEVETTVVYPDQLIYDYSISEEVFAPTVVESLPTVSAYGTWYECGSVSWAATFTEVMYKISQSIGVAITGVSSSGSDVLEVLVRTRLINTDSGLTVPGSINTQVLYRTLGTAVYGSASAIGNFDNAFDTGFHGIVREGFDYKLVVEIQKKQTVGTPTATVTVGYCSVPSYTKAGY